LVEFEDFVGAIDFNEPRFELRNFGHITFSGKGFDDEWIDIWNAEDGTDFESIEVDVGVEFAEESGGEMVSFGDKLDDVGVEKFFEFGLVDGFFR